jgi:hypothetical protein
MEATRSSETSVYNKPTRRHVPEDGILHSHSRENLKSYKEKYIHIKGRKGQKEVTLRKCKEARNS